MTLQSGPQFKRLVANKDRLPAAEWNRLVDRMEALLRSHPQLAFASSGGLSFRRQTAVPNDVVSSRAYARIVQTLQREDIELGLSKRNYYEIELLSLQIANWSADHGTYYVNDLVRYQSKIYYCKIEHNSSSTFPPSVQSHWGDGTNTQAYVFGYSGDLIEAVPWFQVDDIVEVIIYEGTYYIMETVIRVQEGSGEDIICSLYWFQEVDGVKVARCASVYR